MNGKLLCVIFLLLLVGVVVAEPPKCTLVVKPINGDAPLTVMASEESGDATIVDWAWDFGDGNRAFKESKVEHVYSSSGEYRLSVTVINDKGEETSQEQLVVVKEPVTPEPTPTIEPKPDENTTTIVIYSGTTPIASALTAKAAEKGQPEISVFDKAEILKLETDTIMKSEKYPIDVAKPVTSSTNITINYYRCENEKCGYWISAIRDEKEVAVNNPIWLINGNAPYHVIVSEVYDAKTNVQTITLKEDVKGAVFQILTEYADRQPLGKAIVGTKE